MAGVIAIGFDDETTAARAGEELRRRAGELGIQCDAVAVLVRREDGTYEVTTSHHRVPAGPTWGMFWDLLFGLLFFVPVCGMSVGAGMGALFGKVEQLGLDGAFQEEVRAMVRPGTSALFLAADRAGTAAAVAALSGFGGTVLASPLCPDAQAELQDALHGGAVAA